MFGIILKIIPESVLKVILPRVMKGLLAAAARKFRDQRGPEFHGKATQYVLWGRVWAPLIAKWRATPGQVDDVLADYVYYEQAGYIPDGTLADLIRKGNQEHCVGHAAEAAELLNQALRLIERPQSL